ncbi:hypothetical protein l11_09390 [Neisseria weaveri LMG 5135]|nr:hypothetical protein l13_15680 [Neisseria weaveri ATCC 51223]EGV37698.1 hypothetical protein l11_09390 [Neisseria weaveri LMG 5135]
MLPQALQSRFYGLAVLLEKYCWLVFAAVGFNGLLFVLMKFLHNGG